MLFRFECLADIFSEINSASRETTEVFIANDKVKLSSKIRKKWKFMLYATVS